MAGSLSAPFGRGGNVIPIVTIDFETFFSDEYSLKKMTTEAYVRDQRFKAHGYAVRRPGGELGWEDANPLTWLRVCCEAYPLAILCHHAHFDGLILAHHYGIRPALWLDTLSMARLLLGNHLPKGLDALAQHFGLRGKQVPYDLFKGKHWGELDATTQALVAEGACHDVALTWDIFCRMAPEFPTEELALVDATVRLFTEPVLVGDTDHFASVWRDEEAQKQRLLAELGTTGKDIRSNEVFADLLRANAVELPQPGDVGEAETLPYGLKRGKNGPIYAFSKTDDFMRDLLEDEDAGVATLAAARLSEKSNILQTRAQRLHDMSQRGPMCVYLSYCGAHTTRWSGGDNLNWQNRPRNSPLDAGILSPVGTSVIVNDASQIECRLLNYVAGQTDVIEKFRNKEDPYIGIASKFYGFPVTKAHEKERGTGKQLELSCGYGAGGPTIKATAKRGTYGPPVFLDDEQALSARDLYRSTHTAVVALWQYSEQLIRHLASRSPVGIKFNCMELMSGRLYLPNGTFLNYETLDRDENGWFVTTRRGRAKMYGAKLVENFIQALSRVHVAQAWLRIRQAGIRVVSMEHDKLIAVVADHEAEAALTYMKQEMCVAPVWAPGIPLDSDGYISRSFKK
jgi:hypothetical protein